MQEELKKKFLISSAIGLFAVVAIWIFTLSSEEYRVVKGVLVSEALTREVGGVRRHVVTGFRLSYGEAQTSSFSLYVFGEKRRGSLKITLASDDAGPRVTSATFEGQAIESVGKDMPGK